MKRFLAYASVALLGLTACGQPNAVAHPTRAKLAESSLPPMRSFTAARATPVTRSNVDIARDFLDLTFFLESGRELPRLTRFEEPIRIRLSGRTTSVMRSDLGQLVGRLRAEADLDISIVSDGSANVFIHSVAKEEIRRALPHAACFVVPNVSSIQEYRRFRDRPRTDWAQLESRKELAIFVPYDTSPQDARDCLHEELAQAIGPLNDLYRLNDSVFNDDNFHAVLTGFDMLVLRAYYDPDLQNGMTRQQVAARLPAILKRLNPRGENLASARVPDTPREWIDAVHLALAANSSDDHRLNGAKRAIRIAQDLGWGDHRRGFSHYIYARLLQRRDPSLSQSHFAQAQKFFGQSHPDGPQKGFADTQLAAFELSRGNQTAALRIIETELDKALRFENAIQYASLLLLKAEALSQLGRDEEAQAVRLDSLGWARYAFGPEWAVRAKQHEIAQLNVKNRS